MQHEQKAPRAWTKMFMGGLLAVLLLASGGFAANGALHHASQYDHNADAGACLICSLAQGQMDLPDHSPIVTATLSFSLCGLQAASAGVPWSFDFLLLPGRAPPGFSHCL